jgi:hypothetical protein
MVGSVHAISFPVNSRARRPQTSDMGKRMAPRKSIRRSFERCDWCSSSSTGICSFHATMARVRIVGGHCPRNDLYKHTVSVVRWENWLYCFVPAPSNCIGKVSSQWSSETSACGCCNVGVAPPGGYISYRDHVYGARLLTTVFLGSSEVVAHLQ